MCMCGGGENCYPMVPPGKSNAQMVGLPSHPELAMGTTPHLQLLWRYHCP